MLVRQQLRKKLKCYRCPYIKFSLQYIISYSECVTHYSLIQKMYTITKACNEECVGQISIVNV